jgi:hypothetical protein
MAMHESIDFARQPVSAVPLLDATDLPSADDWALLEAIHAGVDDRDFEPDFDRGGRFRLAAAFDD